MLDNKDKIKQLDTKQMLKSIELLGKQIEEVWAQAKKMRLPAAYKKINNIVVLGMGGSALGAHIIKSLFFKELKMPIEIINGYTAPGFGGPKTLAIVSSYSGNTEEVLSAAEDAKKKKAKILVICAGGKLADWAKKRRASMDGVRHDFVKSNKIPALIFTVNNNPCGSPRMGLGYSIFGQLALFAMVGALKLSSAEIKNVLAVIAKYNTLFGVKNITEKNPAKQLAEKLHDKSVWWGASEHLAGNAHAAANQFNENAKRFSGYFILPEMNHHLMEGMLFPDSNSQTVKFVFLESALYDSRVAKRYEITKQILDKNKIEHTSYLCQEKSRLAQVCEILILSGYVSFYSAILQGIDPTAIPFVDFFKAQLKK